MHRMRNSILLLLLLVVILFNIERLDMGEENIINLATAFYLLTMIAILMILSVKKIAKLRQPTLILLWVGVYFVVKLILTSQRPIVGGIYTYLSLTELGLLILAVLLAHNLAVHMEDFEQAVENFTFVDIHKIKRIREADKEIQDEVYRSRRFHRPLSIVVLEHNVKDNLVYYNKLVQEAQRAMIARYATVMLSREVIAQLRRTDYLFEVEDKGKLVIFSPDTDIAEAKVLVGRLSSLTNNGEKITVNFGTATFPDHAVTFDDLMERAEMSLVQQKSSQVSLDLHDEIRIG